MGCGELLALSAVMGHTQATDLLRTAFIVLLLLNLVPLGLLFANLQPAHARLYTPAQQWRVATFLFAINLLIPLTLTLLSGSLVVVSVAITFLLFSSWIIRFVYIKIPHTSPLALRSRR